MIRVMTIDDYDGVYALWKKIKGFGIRSIDDSREGVERFLKRNRPVWLPLKMERWLEVSCADMMEEEAVCIMSVWMRHTGDMGSEKTWSYMP